MRRYDFNEPCNGPNNRTLLSQIPSTYRCPTCDARHVGKYTWTSYQAVIGDNTVWTHDHLVKISDITDGTANTALLLEVSDAKTL